VESRSIETVRFMMRVLLALLFVAAGMAHLLAPQEFLRITPNWVPHAPEVIFTTGLCELVGACALFVRPLRRSAGVAFALYALCVWPANFKHAFDGIQVAGIPSSWWYHGPRLAFQPVIMWWSLFSTEVIDWPFRRQQP
jgi:uncharacterized membrane protein